MDIISIIKDFIYGNAGGLTKKDLSVQRHSFSDLLPYVACSASENHNATTNTQYYYVLKDNSIGFIYECSPMVFAGGAFESLATLLQLSLPDKTVVQTMLYADPYIEDILSHYKALRLNNHKLNNVYREQIEQLCDFFRAGAKDGMWQLSNTPVRNYKLYISIKIPIKADISKNVEQFILEANSYNDMISKSKSTMVGLYLNPQLLHPNSLLTLLSRIFNTDTEPTNKTWDVSQPLCKQIINAETTIKRVSGAMKIGSMYARCITPKKWPHEIDYTTINNMIGYFGVSARSMDDDINQIQCPFIINSTYIYEDLKPYLEARAAQINIQQISGTFAQGTILRKQEASDMKFNLEKEVKYIRAITQIWLFDRDDNVLTNKVNRVVNMWDKIGIGVQKEKSFILPKLFVSALPLGLYGNDYRDLQRDFIMPVSTAAYLMPIQAGYQGMGEPYMLFLDKRAQLASMDILYTGTNKNWLLTGGTGGGKSFLCNYITNSYVSTGAKVRIIDRGFSYQKTVVATGGQFIHFAGEDIIINFFEGISMLEGDDYAAKISMLTGIISVMVTKNIKEPPGNLEISLIEKAINEMCKQYKDNTTIDHIAEWLATRPADGVKTEQYATKAYNLSEALEKYRSTGVYGKYFHGKSNVSFTEQLAVVELDGVPDDLTKVVVLAFASMIEDEIYNGTRTTPTILIIDEAWQLLSENPAAARFAEGLYRKARKYNASIGIATQSLIDTDPETGKIGHIGDVIRMQSNIQFILPDDGLFSAKEKKLLNFTPFEWSFQLTKMPKKSTPYYSEIYVKSELSGGIIRLVTDYFTYFTCTSDPIDNTFINYWSNQFILENQKLTKEEATVLAISKANEVATELGGIGNFQGYVRHHLSAHIPKDDKDEKAVS